MSLGRKAQDEADKALLAMYEEYRKLAAEGTRFVIAKGQNQDILPLSMWREWREWKNRIREIDKQFEKYFK